jgi:formylglycine-generating enzyme required for sulfatase activity
VDAELALAICEGLESRGLTCWIAPRDVGSEGTYGTEIIRGLRESTVFLIVLTAASSESQQVEREAERASHYQKRIIPLSVGGGEPGERLEFYTAGRQRVACAATIDDAFLDRLAAVIRGGHPGPPEPPASPAARRRIPAAVIAGVALVAVVALGLWLSGMVPRRSDPPPAERAEVTPPGPVTTNPAPAPPRQPETSNAARGQLPPAVQEQDRPAGRAAAPPVSRASERTPDAAAVTPPVRPVAADRAPAPAAAGAAPPLVVDGARLRFVSIPRGTFKMGCTPGDEECAEDEKIRKELTVDAFQMSDTEVTQAFWQAITGSNPSDFKGPQQPVENVSWHDAKAFVAKLSQRGDGFSYRLPEEAEWEYAARANGSLPENLSSVAWFAKAGAGSDARPRDVGRGKANAWGLFDMLGNVSEWCEDWFRLDHQRVVRGGSWTDSARSLRFSARQRDVPTAKNYWIGVRVVRIPSRS